MKHSYTERRLVLKNLLQGGISACIAFSFHKRCIKKWMAEIKRKIMVDSRFQKIFNALVFVLCLLAFLIVDYLYSSTKESLLT